MRISPLSLSALIAGLFMAPLSRGALAQTAIANSGTTALRVAVAGQKIDVGLDTFRVESNSKLFPKIDWGTKVVTLVKDLKIRVDGKKIFVPRSVFADMIDPRTASIGSENGDLVLKIAGADGAESYFVRIIFDKTNVKRRIVYSPLAPNDPTEDTAYRLIELKDE